LLGLFFNPEDRGVAFLLHNISSLPVDFTLTEMSTRNIKIIMFLGSKVQWVLRADNRTAICEPIV
jgi:hypothetical protein